MEIPVDGGMTASDGVESMSARRAVSFEVDDLQAAVDRLAVDRYGLVGGISQHENIWRMAYVRGLEGIIVSLAQRIG